jgi:hypothetical protein
MIPRSMRRYFGWLLATALCAAALPSFALDTKETPDKPAARAAAANRHAAIEAHIRARRARECQYTA